MSTFWSPFCPGSQLNKLQEKEKGYVGVARNVLPQGKKIVEKILRYY